ncbi:MAG: guanylate kinase [bacterium]|jgi:guanylate kinase
MNTPGDKKIIILTAPSGAGKTTIKTRLLHQMADRLSFSVSVTTRKKRDGEVDGVDYFFVDEASFKNNIDQHQFIEWEMVYPGMYYGTSVEEIDRIWSEGKTPVLDIDVKGAMNVKRMYGDKVLSIFIEPPSIEVLEQRLQRRGTDTAENITMRINKAREEMSYRNSFDKVILNDDIEKATAETRQLIQAFIG